MFYSLRSLRFFKYFKIAKAYRDWRDNVRYKHYCHQRSLLSSRLFLAKDSFVGALMEMNHLCVEMRESTKLLDASLKATSAYTIEEFDQLQQQRRSEAARTFEQTEEKLQAALVKVCEDVTRRANVSDGNDLDDGDGGDAAKGSKNKSMFAMRQEHLERQRALRKAEEEAQMLGEFIRLADYILVENLVLLAIDSVGAFLGMLENNKEQATQKAMFMTSIHFISTPQPDIGFMPSKDQIAKSLVDMQEGVVNAISAVPRLLYNRGFKPFFEGTVTGPNAEKIVVESPAYIDIVGGLAEQLEMDFVDGRAQAEDYEQYREVADFGETWDYQEYMNAGPSPADMNKVMRDLKTWRTNIRDKMRKQKIVGMLHVDGKKLHNTLLPITENSLENMCDYLRIQARDKCESLLDQYKDNVKQLGDRPTRLDLFSAFVATKESIKEQSRVMAREKDEVDRMYALMADFKVKMEAKDQVNREDLQKEVDEYAARSYEADEFADLQIPSMNKEIMTRSAELDEECQTMMGNLLGGDYVDPGKYNNAKYILQQLGDTKESIDNIKTTAAQLETYVKLFKLPVAEYQNLTDAVDLYETRMKLWTMVDKFNDDTDAWLNSDIRTVKVDDLVKDVQDVVKESTKLSKKAPEDLVCAKLKDEALKWKMWAPVLQDGLCNEALKNRHWAKIYKELGCGFEDDGFCPTLQFLNDNGVMLKKDFVLEMSGVASGEYSLEKSLEGIKTAWQEMNFEVKGHRDSKSVFILGSIEEITTLMEDSQMSLQTMTASKFVVGIRDSVEIWDKKLQLVSEVLDEWMTCQRNWMYLECIFGSADIQKQLPEESKKFQMVDKDWNDVMRRTSKNSNVLYATCQDSDSRDTLEMFINANQKLEEVTKSLEEYLETKRGSFPRFYFLSNDELLEILAQTRDPQAVQPHMQKCFDCISRLEFTDEPESTEIRAMLSPEQEKVVFTEPVFAKGAVENWLTTIEGMMRQSLYHSLKDCVRAYSEETRNTWFFDWPAGMIIAADQVHWAVNVHKSLNAIESGENPNAVKEFFQFHNTQLADMAAVVRGDLTKNERGVMGATIVIDVHAREVLQILITEKAEAVTHFDWNRQLRYYWDDDADEQGDKYIAPEGDCNVRQTNTCFRYGYEYLGNSMRLVITPLTDKCYMTLTGALHAKLGGAPAGPAGTGKTETTKDLGKALAYQCVVFNCSDGLDYKLMGRFFSGLSQAGAWACFDEFNRIDIEVLSVIAQQVMTIANALAELKLEFDFEGRLIPLNWKYGSFITMNPGYAGRSELPDNLKACFRPVAMMVPDYALIAEIMLFSEGFNESKVLSRKMAQLYALSSEQLSNQTHYDFGMRAVKSVLVMAGQLKRSNPDLTEDIVLIRALRDSNVPKFLADDIPLFFAIINDLFPGVEIPNVDYGQLQVAIEACLTKNGLQCVPSFVTKIIQLFETLQVRHGVMVVGVTMTGKTTVFNILAEALTKLHKDGVPHPLQWYENVITHRLNPKSISMNEMYGNFDLATNEWTDGLVALMVRELCANTSIDRKWVIFDGPVDAIWIENMNTVLDDNKTLCLSNGERIKLPPTMATMFEVNDLLVASPATVSRCGMVFLEPRYLTWFPLAQTWMANNEQRIAGITELLTPLLEKTVDSTLVFLRKKCKEHFASMDVNLVTTCMKMMEAHMYLPADQRVEWQAEYFADFPEPGADGFEDLFKLHFVFSFIWSLGGNIDDESRPKFDQHFRSIAGDIGVELPEEGLVYDYMVDNKTRTFVSWEEIVPEFQYDPTKSFFSIMVPTVDTTRLKYLCKKGLEVNYNALVCGNTGVGKTVCIQELLTQMHPDRYVYGQINFSAQTSEGNLQDFFEDKLDKRRKNLLGPPAGKQMIFYIDDLNMPTPEVWGAQPPLELLRQTIEGGFYDKQKVGLFKEVADSRFLMGCGPPGGGRNTVTPRVLRHCHMLTVPNLSESSMKRIFNSILGGFLEISFGEEFTKLTSPIVNATTLAYNWCCKELLPTPAKTHYTFNLRDLAKVVQGVLQANPKSVKHPDELALIWCHEAQRVFCDRLIDTDDKAMFLKLLSEVTQSELHQDIAPEVLGDTLFGDYECQDPSDRKNMYKHVTDMDNLQRLLLEYQEDYVINTMKPMDLVFFKDCVAHLSRCCRVLRQPRGCAMLVGVGGSGRSSVAKLATHMSTTEDGDDYTLFTIEVGRGYGLTQFREDIKELLFKCGIEGKPHTFLFNDTQIADESFLEDVNGLLNAGEVSSLFASDEAERIIGGCRARAKTRGLETRDGIWSDFISTVRENLHIVLAMSPVGDDFRARLRQFPSLVNCCTIDWFTAWPADALLSVAQKYFAKADLGGPEMKNSVCEVCVTIHSSVEEAGFKFKDELRRITYTTPTSYLSLLNMYNSMLSEQRNLITESIRRYQGGIDKIESTKVMVAEMQDSLAALQPVLEKAMADTAKLVVQVEADSVDAAEQKKVVDAEVEVVTAATKEAERIGADAQADLDLAMPAFHSAIKALDSLNKNDITEIKGFAKPPPLVELTLEAVCILCGVKPAWDDAKKMMNDSKFLENLAQYDKDNIAPAKIKKLAKYMKNEDFVPEKVEKVSKAAKSLCMWVRAMDVYDKVAKGVEPKKAALKKANEEVAEMTKQLDGKQSELAAVMAKVAELNAQLKAANDKKKELEDQAKDTEVKLARADKLVGGLGGELVRWKEEVVKLDASKGNLVGSMILSAGIVAYAGPFTSEYRQDLGSNWVQKCQDKNIPVDSEFTLEKCLGIPVEIRQWNLYTLPADPLSTENGIMTKYTKRWPLMIDPQNQANRWIKSMERSNGLQVIKFSTPNFLKMVENCIRVGTPVLLENVAESMDPSLEPVLGKQIFKSAGRWMLRLGDTDVDYNEEFKFYITTKLPNPHYPPEVCVKVTVINFTVTLKGLEDQLLASVVGHERPDLEEQNSALVVQIADGEKKIFELEGEILEQLANASGDILADDTLVNTLSAAKSTSNDVAAATKVAEATKVGIDEAREKYRIAATRGSILYFVVADMAGVDPMYNYSLVYFNVMFSSILEQAAKSDDLPVRLQNLISFSTDFVYKAVCRGLFEKDKPLFSFMMSAKIFLHEGRVKEAEWSYVLRGAGLVDMDALPPNPQPDWLTPAAWANVVSVKGIAGFEGLAQSVAASDARGWRNYCESDTPENDVLPGAFEAAMSPFQRLVILKVFRPEKLVFGIPRYVAAELGQSFIEPPAFDLADAFKDSAPATPMIFVLSSGADINMYLNDLAKNLGFTDKMGSISLGQGQGPIAEALFLRSADMGEWCVLQNCHLAVSWMPALEMLCEKLEVMDLHDDFRLWLTSMPTPKFPIPVLQIGIKLTNEPPKGLKANLARIYVDMKDNTFQDCAKTEAYKKLTYGVAFFHSVIMERRKFGALGWNIPYEWTVSDFQISIKMLKNYLEENDQLPLRILNYVTSVVNYGGRITDAQDIRIADTILSTYYCEEALVDGFSMSEDNIWKMPNDADLQTLEGVRSFIGTMPMEASPTVFGLHENANITYQMNTTNYMINTVLSLQSAAGGTGGKSPEEQAEEIAADIDARMPELLKMDEAHETTFAKMADGSINALANCLMQEMEKFNKMLKYLKVSLNELRRSIKGLVVMSTELEAMFKSFLNGMVPANWSAKSYISRMPLGSWMTDLVERVKFFRTWLTAGSIAGMWVSAFFFPQGALTSALQIYSRKTKTAIDSLAWRSEPMPFMPEDIPSQPPNGVYIYGLFLEGCGWNNSAMHLVESAKAVLYTPFPCIWLDPVNREDPVAVKDPPPPGQFRHPLYKVSTRAGTLSTTGHSTNFVMFLNIPAGPMGQSHWVKRGVAFLCLLDT